MTQPFEEDECRLYGNCAECGDELWTGWKKYNAQWHLCAACKKAYCTNCRSVKKWYGNTYCRWNCTTDCLYGCEKQFPTNLAQKCADCTWDRCPDCFSNGKRQKNKKGIEMPVCDYCEDVKHPKRIGCGCPTCHEIHEWEEQRDARREARQRLRFDPLRNPEDY